MINQRGVIIESGTADTDATWGLYGGYFAWGSGREFSGSPTYPTGPWGTQTDWKFGVLAMQPVVGPYMSARIGPTGGYSSMASLDVQIAQSAFIEYLRTRGIKLNRKRVWHYVILDGVFTVWFVGVVDNTKYSETGCTLSCIDLFKWIHKDAPRVPFTAAEFPNADKATLGSQIPIPLGYVNEAELIDAGSASAYQLVYRAIFSGPVVVESKVTSGIQVPAPSANIAIRLIIGNTVDTPISTGWVGKTLVATAGNTLKFAREIVSVGAPTNFTYQGAAFKTVVVTVSVPFGDGLGGEVDSIPPSWQRVAPSAGWAFQVIDYNQTRVSSEEEIKAFVGPLKQYEDTGFIEASATQAARYTELPDSARSGAIVLAPDTGGTDLNKSVIRRFVQFSSIIFRGFYGISPSSITFPDCGLDCSVLHDRLDTKSTALSVSSITGSLFFEIPLTGIVLADDEDAYLCVNAYLGKASGGGLSWRTRLTLKMCGAIDVGKLWPNTVPPYIPPSSPYSAEPSITEPVNDVAEIFDSNAPAYGKPANGDSTAFMKTIPAGYFSDTSGGSGEMVAVRAASMGSSSEVANKVLRVTDAMKGNPSNALFLEVFFVTNSTVPLANTQLALSEICLVVCKKINTNPPVLYSSLIGQLYGSAWDGRRTASDPVTGIPDIIEHLIRSLDGKPDEVDTDSFDDVSNYYRPTIGPFGWFAGGQMLELKNTADWIDEICKNSMLAMVPGLDGTRRLVAWFDRMQPSLVAITLDASKWVQGSLKEIEQEDAQDVYSEFQLNYDINRAGSGYNKALQINNTDQPTFPLESGPWQEWVVGPFYYYDALALWTAARAGFLETGTKNRLVLDLPWLTDQFNGDPWGATVTGLPSTAAAVLLLSLLVRWSAYPKRFAGGRVAITSATTALRLLDTVYFKDAVLTEGKRYYGWVTDLKVLESEIEVRVLWYPFNSPDEDSFLIQNNGSNSGYLTLDSGSDRIKLN